MTKERVALWDNTRFIAIVLVVWGHTLTRSVTDNELSATIYFWLYSFHIPLFVALAGYFASADPPNSQRMRRLVTDLLVPYLALETIWSVVAMLQRGEFFFDPLRPSWTLWFLLSLATWRVVLLYLVSLRWPLSISVAISVASGYFAVDQTLSLSRTLGLLPFFVIGWYAANNTSIRNFAASSSARHPAVVLGAIGVLLASFVTSWLLSPTLAHSPARWLLTWDRPYAEAFFDQWWAGAVRLGLLAVGLVLLSAVIVLIPRATTVFTRYGSATLYVYLLHSFLLAPIRASGVLSGDIEWWILVATLPASVLIAWLLSLPVVCRVTRPLIQPRLGWLEPKITRNTSS